MSEQPETNSPKQPLKRFGWALTLLVVVLALLAFEAFHYFSAPPMDEEQKALVAWEGVLAPDFTVTNLDGRGILLSDLKGKRIIINFWATWCVPCLAEIPDFIKLREETSATNVVILGLSTDDAATQNAFARRNGVNYPLAILKYVPSPYQDVVTIPVTLVIDRNGVIQHVLFGPQELKTLEKLAAELDFAGTVKPAPVASGQ